MTEMVSSWIEIVILLAGLVLGVRQLRLLARQQKNQYEWDLRRSALEYSLTRSDRLRTARIELDTAFGVLSSKKDPLTLSQIEQAIEENPAVETSIIYMLGHWENMALAINAKVADEEVAYEMCAGMVIAYARVFQNFINHRREANPRAYCYLGDLASRWSSALTGTRPADWKTIGS